MDEVKDYPPYLDYPKPHKAKTNADRIRSMSDEQLANFVHEGCPYIEEECTIKWCVNCILEWLQQPAEKQKEDD